jgi:diguanylate cyclase (GGDEF)-like protein
MAHPYALVANWDSTEAALYGQVLGAEGLEAVLVRDGEDALDALRNRGAPAVLVTDLSLPRTDGFGILGELRRLAPADRSPALVVAASEELRTVAARLRVALGIGEILPKHAPADLVREVLRRLLRGSRQPEPGREDRVQAAEVGRSSLARAASVGILSEASPREALQRLVSETAQAFAVPIALVSLVMPGSEGPQVSLTATFVPSPDAVQGCSLLREVIGSREPLIVPDAAEHPLFAEDPFVRTGVVRGYAGVPLIGPKGEGRGALCLIDVKPLRLGATELDVLMGLARRLAAELELHALVQRSTEEARRLSEQLNSERERSRDYVSSLSRLALTDQLTGLANRRGGQEALAREVARSRRTGAKLSFALFDLDHFKRLNDLRGHAAGDMVLREFGRILLASLRASDVAIRWGGEEFLIVLPEVTLEGARTLAERVRSSLAGLDFGPAGRVTTSAGVSELQPNEDADAAIARADARLYEAKTAGRNLVA